MTTYKTELEIIRQIFNTLGKSKSDKKSFLKSIKFKERTKQSLVFKREIKCCARCKFTHFVKNGKKDGKQRYICMDCNKTFTNTNDTILFKTQKDLEIWQQYIYCMIERYSLRKSAEICGIALSTAFFGDIKY